MASSQPTKLTANTRFSRRGRTTVAAGAAFVVLLVGAGPVFAKVGQSAQPAPTRGAVLDLARASDAAVEAEAARLTAAVALQKANLASAQQAEEAAKRDLDKADADFAAIQVRVDAARRHLVAQGVGAYMEGGAASAVSLILEPARTQEEIRRQEYVTSAQTVTADSISELQSTQRESNDARKRLQRARQAAADLSTAATAQGAALLDAEKLNQDTHTALQARIQELQVESPDLAALDAQIQALAVAQDASATKALGLVPAGAPANPLDPTAAVAPPPSTTPPDTLPGNSSFGLIWPLHGPVTSEYGPRWGGFHPGVDIAPPFGTPIAAAKDGLVVYAGWNGGYGNFVLIDHGFGMATGYAHQSRIEVTVGQIVRQGQIIGLEGSTGDSTGPHLHFEVRINGATKNPRDYELGSP